MDPMAELGVSIGGLRLANPVLLASGILGETGQSMLRVFHGGAGAVVTKSIGNEARPGHPGPNFLEVAGGYINAMGLPNAGIDEYEMEISTALDGGAILVGSLYGEGPREYADLAGRMQGMGVSALELNLSCPHAGGTGMELGTDPRMVAEITAAVKGAVGIPVLVKLTPNITDIRIIALAAARAGADAVVAINTLKAMAIDPVATRPVLGNAVGGFSGPALKHVGLRMVWDIYRAFKGIDVPGGSGGGGAGSAGLWGTAIVGVGGIESGTDAAEYLLAGADAVQVGSALVDGGPDTPGRVARELGEWMDGMGFSSVDELKGRAHD